MGDAEDPLGGNRRRMRIPGASPNAMNAARRALGTLLVSGWRDHRLSGVLWIAGWAVKRTRFLFGLGPSGDY